jgi:hypothetical protein
MKENTFTFWKNWLLLANIFTLMVGVLVAFAGNSVIFELHNQGTSAVFFKEAPMPENVIEMKNWLFGIIGGTIVGFHLLALFIIQNAFARKERWAWYALSLGLLSWFLIDSSISMFYGAKYNLYLINIPAFLMIGFPLAFTWKSFFK